MTNFANELLKEAYKNYKLSMAEFEMMQNAENEGDKGLAEAFWNSCELYSGQARGLLKAYEMLTGTKLYEHQIEDYLS